MFGSLLISASAILALALFSIISSPCWLVKSTTCAPSTIFARLQQKAANLSAHQSLIWVLKLQSGTSSKLQLGTSLKLQLGTSSNDSKQRPPYSRITSVSKAISEPAAA